MGERRKPGMGSVTRIASGHWVRVTLSDERRPSLGVYATEEEAHEVLRAALEKLSTGEFAPVGGITLRKFGERWLRERELHGDVRGVAVELNRWKTHVESSDLADLPVAAITPRDVARWLKVVRAKKVATPHRRGPRKTISRKTASEALLLLKLCLAAAATPEEGIIAGSPAVGIKLKREVRTHEAWDYLRPHEQEAIGRCAAIPESARLMMLFAIGAGLRLGEQMNLELADLDVDGAHPEITVRFGSKGKPPKSGKIRRVPLFGVALDAARRWLEVLPSYAPKNPERLVFPGPRGARRAKGKHLHTTVLRDKKPVKVDRFKEHLTAAGITRPVRWHDLRHTCASSLVAGWWGPAWRIEEVKEVLGHSSITVTERYAHLADSTLRTLASATRGGGGGGADSPPREGYDLASGDLDAGPNPQQDQQGGSTGTRTLDLRVKSPLDSAEAAPSWRVANRHITADAEAALRALARGDGETGRGLARAVAAAVLDEPMARLARAVLEGGPHADVRAAELCELVMASGAGEAGAPATGTRS